MEELRSTEILDKEIQEDARRKAEKILKEAEETAAQVLHGVDDRLASIEKEKKLFYAEKEAVTRRDAEAAIPLKKARFLVSYEDTSVREAINSYLTAIGNEKKLELLKNMLVSRKPVLQNRKLHALTGGFDIKKLEKLLQTELGKESVLSCKEAAAADGVFEGFILESEDKSVKCRITISELIEEILDKNRYELVSTLFGGDLPNE